MLDRSVRFKAACASAIVSAMTAASFAQGARQDRPGRAAPSVVFHVPPELNTADLEITYFMIGAFGGYGSFIRGAANARDYPLETSRDGKAAASLKAYAYAPGFGFTFVTLDLTQGPSSRTVELRFQRLGTVRLTGRVAVREGQSLDGLRVLAAYDHPWHCEFFGLIDCLSAIGKPFASAPIAADGSFVLALPDFARDPGLTSFQYKGEFSLRAQTAAGEDLALAGDATRVPLADRYDRLMQFTLRGK